MSVNGASFNIPPEVTTRMRKLQAMAKDPSSPQEAAVARRKLQDLEERYGVLVGQDDANEDVPPMGHPGPQSASSDKHGFPEDIMRWWSENAAKHGDWRWHRSDRQQESAPPPPPPKDHTQTDPEARLYHSILREAEELASKGPGSFMSVITSLVKLLHDNAASLANTAESLDDHVDRVMASNMQVICMNQALIAKVLLVIACSTGDMDLIRAKGMLKNMAQEIKEKGARRESKADQSPFRRYTSGG